MKHFETATASLPGRTHRDLRYNNQDAWALHHDETLLAGFVADGCGSQRASETGARLGVDFAVGHARRVRDAFEPGAFFDALQRYLRALVDAHQPHDPEAFIRGHLLFTLLGFVITPAITTVVHLGDGYYRINDLDVVVEQHNRPDYPARALLGESVTPSVQRLPTTELRHLLIATDGMEDLVEAFGQGQSFDGMTGVGDLLDHGPFYEQPAALPRFLDTLATAGPVLRDDTTLVMVRATP